MIDGLKRRYEVLDSTGNIWELWAESIEKARADFAQDNPAIDFEVFNFGACPRMCSLETYRQIQAHFGLNAVSAAHVFDLLMKDVLEGDKADDQRIDSDC